MKPGIDYGTFWKTVTNHGKNRCELAEAPCHRCGGSGKVEAVEDVQLDLLDASATQRYCLRCKGSGKVPCSFVIDAHHFVPKRRLRTTAAKQDVRNGVTLCREHHDLVENGILRAPRPTLLSFFLSEHGVTQGQVPAAYGEGE